jgi:hydroxymethylbilane synthase
VRDRIQQTGGPPVEIVIIKTTGDRLQDAPLSQIGGKRLFVKEIEDALLSGAVDLAVHSSKDMPVVLPDGLAIGAVLPREEPLDAIVLPGHAPPVDSLDDLIGRLSQTPKIGTSSVRRIAQLARLVPGAHFAPMRGNLDTRLRKLDEGQYSAIVLAAAGLRRLGFESRISMVVPLAACVPAPGQGIVAIEHRAGDTRVAQAIAPINDPVAGAALTAERAVVTALGGGCQMPLGALAVPDGADFELHGIVVSLDGSRAVRRHVRGPQAGAAALGDRLAMLLVAEGAGDILDEVRHAQAPVDGVQP